MIRSFVMTLVCLGIVGPARADDRFDRIWAAVESHSPALRGEAAATEAAGISRSRSARHWLPRLSLSANAVSTDSPSTLLFSTLGARSLEAADLSPSAMNDPPRRWFRSGNLTLDLPLLEGGSRIAASRGAGLMEESQVLAQAARKSEIFAETVKNYAAVLIGKEERATLESLRKKLAGVIGRYRVGSKSNPVGYSGLLGMRSLLNRIESALDANRIEMESNLDALRVRSELSDLTADSVVEADVVRFAQAKLGAEASAGVDLRTAAQESAARAMSEYAKAERARWLPMVGLFASGTGVAGPRDSGTSTEYGAYLQWRLFDGTNLGAYREASLRAQAMDAKAAGLRQEADIGRSANRKMLPVLLANLGRIEDSASLTAEQTDTTETLFRNGSVNALQFSEVLARRADLIEARRDVQRSVLGALAERYMLNRGSDEHAQ